MPIYLHLTQPTVGFEDLLVFVLCLKNLFLAGHIITFEMQLLY
jgi:hypothetical protein